MTRLDGMGFLSGRQQLGLGNWRRRHLGCPRVTYPDQDAIRLIHGELLGMDEFVLEILQIVVVQSKLSLDGPIRDALLALQPGNDLGQHL